MSLGLLAPFISFCAGTAPKAFASGLHATAIWLMHRNRLMMVNRLPQEAATMAKGSVAQRRYYSKNAGGTPALQVFAADTGATTAITLQHRNRLMIETSAAACDNRSEFQRSSSLNTEVCDREGALASTRGRVRSPMKERLTQPPLQLFKAEHAFFPLSAVLVRRPQCVRGNSDAQAFSRK